jgi:hypothetical protein
MAGAGPIAWWQLLHLWRSTSAIYYSSAVVLAIVFAILLVHDSEDVRVFLWILLSQVAVMESFIAAFMPLGLRTDIDRLDALKSLPISPAAIVVGEIVPAALVLSLGQCLLLAGLAAINKNAFTVAAAMICFTLPVNLLLLGLNNMLFLIFPYRAARDAAELANVQMHQLVVYLLYSVIIGVFVMVAVTGGLIGYAVTGSLVGFAVAAWCVVALEVVVVFMAAFRAFHRFDVSLETPPE